MKVIRWPRPVWLGATGTALAVVLVPYLFSRFASPWQRISIHSASDLSAGASRPLAAAPPLRVASYNIAHGRGLAVSNWDGGSRGERTARLDQIAELLARLDADVVVLNEVDFDASWSYSVNQAEYLSREAGYPYWAEERNLDFRVLWWTWRFGNAVLSRLPIIDAQAVDLPSYSGAETLLAGKKRGLACGVEVGERVIRVVVAHLSSRAESLRVASAGVLVDTASADAVPTILAGDLNSTPPGFPGSRADANGENAVAVLDRSGSFRRPALSRPITDHDMTFHSANPTSIIDWVLIPPDWQYLEYRVEPSTLSDHRPVIAEVGPMTTAGYTGAH